MTAFRQRLVYLLTAINVAIHFGHLPTWVPMTALVLIMWRWLADLIRLPIPNLAVNGVLGALAMAGVVAEFGTPLMLEAALSMLVLMVALKIFEIRGYRDVMIVTYLCLVLLMGILLDRQTMFITVFMILDVVAVLALLHLFHLPPGRALSPLKSAFSLLVRATPVLIILFVFFPRFNFGLLSRPTNTMGKTGFSDRISPGQVSSIVRSNEVAFRAFFPDGDRPPLQTLYWRGAVLSEGSGLEWEKVNRRLRRPLLTPTGNKVQILLEEAATNWLFTVDWPNGIKFEAYAREMALVERPGRTFEMTRLGKGRESYDVYYQPSARLVRWPGEVISEDLVIDDQGPKVQELVKSFGRLGRQTETQIVSKIREYIQEQNFRYSLTPPPVKTLEDFLFESKTGFCEHFAAATVSLLRLAGVPARVVVGYQGGEASLMGDYVIVSQQDAHAWLEFWNSQGEFWQRLDPTSWVAPERISLGANQYFSRSFPGLQTTAAKNLLQSLFGREMANWLMRGWLLFDQAEIAWVNFLVRYDFDFQASLIEAISGKKLSRAMLFLVVSLAVILALVIIAIFERRRRERSFDPLAEEYQKLVRHLAKKGLRKDLSLRPGEAPLTYALRVRESLPEEWSRYEPFFRRWMELRYGRGVVSLDEARELKQLIRQATSQRTTPLAR